MSYIDIGEVLLEEGETKGGQNSEDEKNKAAHLSLRLIALRNVNFFTALLSHQLYL